LIELYDIKNFWLCGRQYLSTLYTGSTTGIFNDNTNTYSSATTDAIKCIGRYKEAIKCYDKVLEIDSSYIDAWYDKGISLYNIGRHKEAIECKKNWECELCCMGLYLLGSKQLYYSCYQEVNQ